MSSSVIPVLVKIWSKCFFSFFFTNLQVWFRTQWAKSHVSILLTSSISLNLMSSECSMYERWCFSHNGPPSIPVWNKDHKEQHVTNKLAQICWRRKPVICVVLTTRSVFEYGVLRCHKKNVINRERYSFKLSHLFAAVPPFLSIYRAWSEAPDDQIDQLSLSWAPRSAAPALPVRDI